MHIKFVNLQKAEGGEKREIRSSIRTFLFGNGDIRTVQIQQQLRINYVISLTKKVDVIKPPIGFQWLEQPGQCSVINLSCNVQKEKNDHSFGVATYKI